MRLYNLIKSQLLFMQHLAYVQVYEYFIAVTVLLSGGALGFYGEYFLLIVLVFFLEFHIV